MLKRELIRGIVISNTCVKLYRNWIINEVTERVNIRTNERTYVLTYIRTGQTLYPLLNFVVRGDNKSKQEPACVQQYHRILDILSDCTSCLLCISFSRFSVLYINLNYNYYHKFINKNSPDYMSRTLSVIEIFSNKKI